MLTGKTVLITGATGFIGSHLVERLLGDGALVRAMAHYRSDPSLHNLELLEEEERSAVEVIRGDVRDAYFVRGAVAGCDVVMHLAALIGIPYSYEAPASYVGTNVLGTLNVLEACRSEGASRLVHTSTSECYGSALYTPIDEGHALQAQSPYSATKIAADKLVDSYHLAFGLPTVTLRPFNTYGPRQSARAVIPTIISQLLSGENRIRLGSLSPVRDLTFVSDTVDGFVRAGSAPDIEGQTINLGVGSGISIGDLANGIMDVVGRKVDIETDEQRVRPATSEVLELISDNRKARKLLDWRPLVSLGDGLQKTVAFVSAHRELFATETYGK